MNIIVKMKFGSHLYGTDTPDSDLDYKGVFLPTKEEVLLNRIPKSYSISTKKGNEDRNTSDDVDSEIYSLHYFLKLACEGQTVALDMLHAPTSVIIEKSSIWDEITSNKEKFYTKNLQAFVGYARRQASKYGIKGSRLNAVQKIIDIFSQHPGHNKVLTIWDQIPFGEHIYQVNCTPNNLKQFQVCGKIFQETASIDYVLGSIQRFYKEYGKRARMAAKNEGIDWKAVSHAMRAAFQMKELFISSNIIFPLKNAKYLTEIKQGKHDYLTEVSPTIERLMDEIEELSAKSLFPMKVNRKFWDRFLITILEEYLFGSVRL